MSKGAVLKYTGMWTNSNVYEVVLDWSLLILVIKFYDMHYTFI